MKLNLLEMSTQDMKKQIKYKEIRLSRKIWFNQIKFSNQHHLLEQA